MKTLVERNLPLCAGFGKALTRNVRDAAPTCDFCGLVVLNAQFLAHCLPVGSLLRTPRAGLIDKPMARDC